MIVDCSNCVVNFFPCKSEEIRDKRLNDRDRNSTLFRNLRLFHKLYRRPFLYIPAQ